MRLTAVQDKRISHSYLERELINLFPDSLDGPLVATSDIAYCTVVLVSSMVSVNYSY